MSQTATRRFKRRYTAVKNRGHERIPSHGAPKRMSGVHAALKAFGTSRYVELFLERNPKPTAPPEPTPDMKVELPAPAAAEQTETPANV